MKSMADGWPRIGWLYLTGVLAAAQLGKMAALAPVIGQDLSFGLTTTALAVSLLEIGGATFGLIAGSLIDRIGGRTALASGLGLLALAGLGEAFADTPMSLLAWRVIESVGYLAIVIAAPVLIHQTATAERRGVALALWSSFVPVGMALGAMLSGVTAEILSWRTAMLCWSAVALLAGVIGAATPIVRMTQLRSADRRWPAHRAWMLAAGFGCYAAFEVGMLALLPSFLIERTGASPADAGLITACASFATVLGSVVAAWCVRRDRRQDIAVTVSLILPAGLLFLLFRDRQDLAIAAIVAIALNGVSGIFPGLAFALLPKVAGHPDALAKANGLLTQFGAGGSLLGPPSFALSVSSWGWSGAAVVGVIASAMCLLLALLAWPVMARPTNPDLARECP